MENAKPSHVTLEGISECSKGDTERTKAAVVSHHGTIGCSSPEADWIRIFGQEFWKEHVLPKLDQ